MAESALAAVAAHHLSSRVVSVPRPSATPAEVAQARAQGYVVPLYTGTPAPIGIADFGLSAGSGGSVVASVLNTTSLRGQIDTGSAGIHGLDLADSSPDAFGMQLNSVLTNVTLFGQSGYSFWTQDIALYYPGSDQLYLDSNIWNWSGGPLTPNVFYQHGPFGVQVDESFYYALIGPFTVSYPFQLTFYLNSTLVGGRDAVYFGAHITSPAGSVEYPYWDYAVFNSTAYGGPSLTQPSNYTANGFEYNPIGLTDDFELILGGPNGGSQADLVTADATMGLAYLAGSTYRAVPSASSAGGETGETVTGAYVGWSQGSEGPGGLSPYGVVSTGPAILSGLWNAGRPRGVIPVVLDLRPSNAFLFVNASSNPFTVSEPEYAPTLTTATLYLSPGTYRYTVELSNYAPRTGTLVVPGPGAHGPPTVLHVSLPRDMRRGIYTPLFAWENSQLPSISYFGLGVPWFPYFVFNNQNAPIGTLFGVVNDYGYPVFPGVLLVGTTASVEFYSPPSFVTEFAGEFVYPYENSLPWWFSGVSHVAVVGGSNITGWFGFNVYGPGYWTPFDMVFYNSERNLVARNVFDVSGGGGLLLAGGGNNTVWGNTFNEVLPTGYNFAIGYGQGLGIQVAESNDLIYNNNVETPTTAWQLIFNLYTGASELFSNRWNVSVQPAWFAHFASGFPLVPLTGSIAGSAWQGGNFWWDYGLALNPYNGAVNPYGQLPYTENAVTPLGYSPYIYPGGDYAPLP
jgi:thermopsin